MATAAKLFVELGFVDKATGKMTKSGKKIQKIGLGIAAGLTGAAILGGKALLDIGKDFDALQDQLRIGTGKTGDDLDSLAQSALNVFKQIPTSMELVGTAFTVLDQKTEQTGQGLEDLAKNELELARITGEDLNTVLTSTTKLFDNWQIAVEDQVGTLDKLLRVSQATGIPVAQLSDELSQYGPILRQLGFDLDSSIAFLGAIYDAGLDATTVVQGLKIAFKNWTAAGITDMQEQLKTVFDLIKNAPSDLEAGRIAIENFGAKAGPGLADAIRTGRLSYEDLLAVVQGGTDTVLDAASDTNDLAEKWQIFKNQMTVAVLPAATALFDYLNTTGIPALTNMATKVGELTASFENLSPAMQKTVGGFGLFLAVAAPLVLVLRFIISNATAFGAVLGTLIVPITIVEALLIQLGPILIAGSVILQAFRTNLMSVGDAFRWLGERIAQLYTYAQSVLTSMLAFFTDTFNAIQAVSVTDIVGMKEAVLANMSILFTKTKAWMLVIGQVFSVVFDTIVDDVSQKARTIYDRVMDTLDMIAADSYDAMWAAGSNIGAGIMDGINSVWSAVVSTAGALAQAAWDEIMSKLHIHSPSQLTMWAGEMLGEGLAQGMDNANRSVSAAASRMTGAAMSGMTNNYGGISISVSGAGDPTAVADRVFEKFVREMSLSRGA